MITVIVALILAVQSLTFVALGFVFIAAGNVPLGLAQLLLAAVQGLVYSGGLP